MAKQEATIDRVRTTFRQAYEHYVAEGLRMGDLLKKERATGATELSQTISNQQKRLDEALRNYEDARTAYVSNVLAGFAGSGGAQL